QLGCELDSVHTRHVQVDHAEVEQHAGFGRGSRKSKRLDAIDGLNGLDSPGGQLFAQDHAVGGVVVDDERTSAVEGSDVPVDGGRLRALGAAQRQLEPKRRTLTGGTGQTELAAHELDQLT